MNDLIQITVSEQHRSPEGFSIMRGWNPWVMEQLVVRSVEPEMKTWVPKDSSERFSSLESAALWGDRDEHVVYNLVHEDRLVGIVWFTKYDEPKVEDADYTFAIRMYEGARGKGLASIFAEAAIEDLGRHTGYNGKIWLETGIDNEVALRLYYRIGFKDSSSHGDRITLIRPGTSK